jgi:hypothetical protein
LVRDHRLAAHTGRSGQAGIGQGGADFPESWDAGRMIRASIPGFLTLFWRAVE